VLETRPIEIPTFDWESHSKLQKDLAENYVSVISGKVDSAKIQELAKAGKLGYQEFFTAEPSYFSKQLDLNFASLDQAEKVIVAVFVPSHKPLNQFGMDLDVLDEIKTLVRSKTCILVHFGNPLALKHLGDLDDFEAVVCGYQGFEEVQGMVAKTLQGL
jgi:hypothetical protein